jgi:hypothetical protein
MHSNFRARERWKIPVLRLSIRRRMDEVHRLQGLAEELIQIKIWKVLAPETRQTLTAAAAIKA